MNQRDPAQQAGPITKLLAVFAAACATATIGGCSVPAERDAYLESRAVAIEPGAASASDRPLAMFSTGLLE